MGKKIRTRLLIILAVTLLGLYLIIRPHHKITAQDFISWSQIKQNLGENIHLGLDLKGGSHLVLQVQVNEALQKRTEKSAEAMRAKLKEKNIPFTDVKNEGIDTVVVTVPDSTKNSDIASELDRNLGSGWTISDKGSSVVAEMTEAAANQVRENAIESAKETILTRVNAFGVAEPVVARQGGEGTYQILVQMPGLDDTERVKNTLNADSNLELRLQAKNTAVYPTREAAESALKAMAGGSDQFEIFADHERGTTEGGTGEDGFVILEKSVVVSGLDMRDATARPSATGSSQYQIAFSLQPEGATRFADVTGKNIHEMLCIVLNNEVKSRATIQSQIHDQGEITGSFTKRAAEDLALILRSGALPAKAVYLEERTVGPSLGADSIRQGVTASIAGLLAVIAVMLFYYRGSGINAVLALILNLVLLLAVLSFGAVLTLPGIAGVILTIGMAVDSNVLIFERIREELRNGKVVASAVDVGFNKAFLTIIDTHVTTVVSAIFLFVFGTGPIRGFAVTLVIGLLANLFTAVFVSRTIFMWHLNRKARVETLSI